MQAGVWETLLAALEILIRVHHPQQVFNIRQFLKAQEVHRFLLTCQVLQVRCTLGNGVHCRLFTLRLGQCPVNHQPLSGDCTTVSQFNFFSVAALFNNGP